MQIDKLLQDELPQVKSNANINKPNITIDKKIGIRIVNGMYLLLIIWIPYPDYSITNNISSNKENQDKSL